MRFRVHPMMWIGMAGAVLILVGTVINRPGILLSAWPVWVGVAGLVVVRQTVARIVRRRAQHRIYMQQAVPRSLAVRPPAPATSPTVSVPEPEQMVVRHVHLQGGRTYHPVACPGGCNGDGRVRHPDDPNDRVPCPELDPWKTQEKEPW